MLVAAARWPDDPSFARLAPMNAVALALLITPFISTWVMPTRSSLYIFPPIAFVLWWLSGWIGETFVPPPEEPRYMCGLPMLGMMLFGSAGLLASVVGRALGLNAIGKVSAVGVYLVQLIPIGALSAFFALISACPSP